MAYSGDYFPGWGFDELAREIGSQFSDIDVRDQYPARINETDFFDGARVDERGQAFHYQLLSGETWGLSSTTNSPSQRGGVQRTTVGAGGTYVSARRQTASTVQDPIWTPQKILGSSFTGNGETASAEGKRERDQTGVVEAGRVPKRQRRPDATRRSPASEPVQRAGFAHHGADTSSEGANAQPARQSRVYESTDRRTEAPYGAVLTYRSKRSPLP